MSQRAVEQRTLSSLSFSSRVSAVMIHGYIFHHFFDHVFGFFPLCPKKLLLSLYFKSWIWHSIIPLSGLNGKMAVECRWGLVIEFNIIWLVSVLVPEGWFICVSFSLCFLLLHPVKIFWRGLGPCMILTSINVVKMSCVPRVSESHDIYHGSGIPWQWLYQKTSFFNDGHPKVAVYSDANILV